MEGVLQGVGLQIVVAVQLQVIGLVHRIIRRLGELDVHLLASGQVVQTVRVIQLDPVQSVLDEALLTLGLLLLLLVHQ